VSPEQLAYAAGLFDGEGTVQISRPTAKRPREHRLRIAVTMTHEPTVRWLADTFGGTARGVMAPSVSGRGRRPRWEWAVQAVAAARFLAAVRPWLITKAEAADLALAFQHRLKPGQGTNGRRQTAVSEVRAREALRRRLRWANGSRLCDIVASSTIVAVT
jgi:hypothetical protein